MKVPVRVLAVVLTLLAAPVAAQQTRADLAVVVTLSTDPAYGVRGDGAAPYTHATQNVRAILTGFAEGNLVLDTNDAAKKDGGRRVVLDFKGQAGMASGPADVFMPMRSVDLTALSDDLRTLLPGSTVQKRLNINWSGRSVNYHLRWNGEGTHGFATVTCTAPATTNAAAGDTCGAWTFSAGPADLAGLYTSPTKGTYKETWLAAVSMPLQGTITVK